ncbi:MAG: phenylalanine--tRNA ligase subunit beta [Nanoarchaeota archaeon]|nr:phenylalanine--tRNA ligase subunit beta [Nanoarchaeota archaeon]
MANIKIPRKQFEKEIGKLDEKMQGRIALFGTPVESLTDSDLELEIFPNRPDLLSYHGFKRAFLAFLGKKTGLKDYKIHKPEKNYEVKIESSVKDVRPYTLCAIIKGLRLDDDKIKEIIDIQEKLHSTIGRKRKKVAIGIYPLDKIKLPITYKALEPDKIKFLPLESTREMSGLEILQRHPTGKEYAHLLSGKTKFPIFIDSDKKVLSMPPIINSENTGRVTDKTKEIFIECSGHDFKTLEKCLNILVTTFAEMGGSIYSMKINLKELRESPSLKATKKKISLKDTNKILGLDLSEKELRQNLEKMGHNYSKGEVEIASWRTDILHEIDLIEDIAIAYGYENFNPEIPKISTIGEEDKKETFKRKISEILTGIGFLETSNFHLISKEDQFKNMGVNEKQIKETLEILNSKTENDFLRKNLSSYIMKTFSKNSDSEYPQKIFETGRVFEEKEEIEESEKLAIGIAPGNFTDIKQVLEYLTKALDIKVEVKEMEEIPSHLIDGRVGEIIFNGNKIGHLGEVHPKILKNWKIKMPVSILEIDLGELFQKY